MSSGVTDRQRTLSQFLEEQELMVADVVAGATPATKRLFVADRETGRIRYAVSVSQGDGGDAAVSNEALVLRFLGESLHDNLSSAVPSEVERVEASRGETALVVTAVPGLERPNPFPETAAEVRRTVDGTVTFLGHLWQRTASDRGPTELGREPIDMLLTRYRGVTSVLPAIGVLIHARERLAAVDVVQTATHGCLCPRHVFREEAHVIGLDDWGLGAVRADPVRDLGHLAVSVAAHRLPEVVNGRTTLAGHVRHGVGRGLELLHAPPRLWRDVLLLAQFEAAMTDLTRGDPAALSLLKEAVRSVPARS